MKAESTPTRQSSRRQSFQPWGAAQRFVPALMVVGVTLGGIALGGIVFGGCRRAESPAPPIVEQETAANAVLEDALGSIPESSVRRKQGRVVSVDLSDVEVGPEAADTISRMTQLRSLRVSGAMWDDEQAAKLGALSQLEALSLHDTTVSDAGLAFLERLPRLKELSLTGTPVTDAALVAIAKLPELRKLRLRRTRVTGQDVAPLGHLPVEDLELSETDFGNAGMAAVAQMPSLKRLNLWLTPIDDQGLAELEGTTSLTLLNLDNVSGITDASLPLILQQTELELLHLGGTGISADAVTQLKSLQQLKTLFITRLGVSESVAEQLRSELPALERFEY